MVSITLSVSKKLKKEMEEFPEINWSEVARQAITKKVFVLRKFQEFAKESELTPDEALSFGAQISKRVAKRRKG